MTDAELQGLEQRIGYAFVDRDLLRLALTHTTWVEEHRRGENSRAVASQQRLEFLGDALLGYAIARWLFDVFPNADEGNLTERRKQFARASWLRAKGADLGLRALIRFGRGGEAEADRNQQLLGDTAEAVIGAVALDGGDAAALAMIVSWLLSAPPEPVSRDPISALVEWHHKRYHEAPPEPDYDFSGPDNERTWTATLGVGGVVASGQGGKKQDAKREACKAILAQLDPQ